VTAQPHRVQRRRSKGWRTPPNTVIVTRPSRFGNPFTLAMAYELGYARHGDTEQARKAVVGAFEDWLNGNRMMWQSAEGDAARQRILDGLPELRGKNLACWCPLPEPGQPDHCHATVLLELAANSTTMESR
jgi:hypothetical protein